MQTLNPGLTDIAVSVLPIDIQRLLKKFSSELIVAGGFVRDALSNRQPKDIDFFSISSETMKKVIAEIKTWKSIKIKPYTPNSFSVLYQMDSESEEYTVPLQFITRTYYQNHTDLIESFDFSICQAGVFWDGSKWIGISSDQFLQDIANEEMHYTAPQRDEDIGASVLRLRRFMEKGYKISEVEFSKVLGRFFAELYNEDPAAIRKINETTGFERISKAFRSVGYGGRKPEPEPAIFGDELAIPF